MQEVKTLAQANHSQTVDEAISYVTCHKILSDDLNMSCVNQQCSMRPDARPT
jgi:hypothetical protein